MGQEILAALRLLFQVPKVGTTMIVVTGGCIHPGLCVRWLCSNIPLWSSP